MILPDYEDEEETAALWRAALPDAAVILAMLPPDALPDLPDTAEAYLAGILFCAATTHVVAGLNGLIVRFPALADTDAYQLTVRDVPIRLAEALAARFRGLAAVCDSQAATADSVSAGSLIPSPSVGSRTSADDSGMTDKSSP